MVKLTFSLPSASPSAPLSSLSPLWLRAVFWGLLINKIQRLRLLFLIGQVEPLPHSGAGDAASSRILHARLFLFLVESLAVARREKTGTRDEPRVPDGPGALHTPHFPSREESGAQEQPLSLSLSLSLPLSLSHAHNLSESLSVSLAPSRTHIRARAHARSAYVSTLPW